MNFKLGYVTLPWGEAPDIRKMLEGIEMAGFVGIEFQQSIDYLGGANELRRLVKHIDLQITAVGGGSPLLGDDKKEIEKHKERIEDQ